MKIVIPSQNTLLKTNNPQFQIVLAFLITIFVGFFLLALPISSKDNSWHLNVDTLFTTTSAVCVTGLDCIEINKALTPFGLTILTILVQLGGLGIMTIGTIFFVMMGKQLSASSERAASMSLAETKPITHRDTLRKTLYFTLGWELIGTILIALAFLVNDHYTSVDTAFLHGLFFSIMAFCNAGFSLFSNNFANFQNDYFVLLVMSTLIIAGGLGFIVLSNLSNIRLTRNKSNRGRLSLHTKVVLLTTLLIFIVFGTLFAILEWNEAFAKFSSGEKLVHSFFHTAVSRTAGFSAIPTSSLTHTSLIFTMLVMIIGGAPGSTAGGIKITTAAVLIATVVSIIRDRRDTEILHRRISNHVIKESIAIIILSLSILFCAIFVMAVVEPTQNTSSIGYIFEVVSAFCTTGLSTGITSELTPLGKLCITICMFVGRLGPVTLAMTIANSNKQQFIRYPEENITVG